MNIYKVPVGPMAISLGLDESLAGVVDGEEDLGGHAITCVIDGELFAMNAKINRRTKVDQEDGAPGRVQRLVSFYGERGKVLLYRAKGKLFEHFPSNHVTVIITLSNLFSSIASNFEGFQKVLE